jgi:hypothetical protein
MRPPDGGPEASRGGATSYFLQTPGILPIVPELSGDQTVVLEIAFVGTRDRSSQIICYLETVLFLGVLVIHDYVGQFNEIFGLEGDGSRGVFQG